VREITPRLHVFFLSVHMLRPGTIGADLLAFASVAVATALRLAIGPYVEGLHQWIGCRPFFGSAQR
jgi:hypothetical protein